MLRYAATSDWGSRPRYFSVRTSVAMEPPTANIPKGFWTSRGGSHVSARLEEADETPELERGQAERHDQEEDGFDVQSRLRVKLFHIHVLSDSRTCATERSYERGG